MNRIVLRKDSTLIADYKAECTNGTYYIYIDNDAIIPENEIYENVKSLKACLADGIHLEKYLEKYYDALVSIKIVKCNGEVYVVDNNNVYDLTDIKKRIYDKFTELINNFRNKKRKSNNFTIFIFVIALLLSASVNNPHENEIAQKGEELAYHNERYINERFQQWMDYITYRNNP